MLGGTAAMFGHANPHVVEAISRQLAQGSVSMLPSADGIWVAEELTRRFGLPFWQHATSSTDGNRFSIRIARMLTGRPKIVVFNGNYHGSVDETQVELDDAGAMVPRRMVDPNGVKHEETTKVVEFNDAEALEAALRPGDVAAVLCEPMLTNVGLAPALPGYHNRLRELTRRYGTLLIFDETHTLACGPGGYTKAYGLSPDMIVLGKALAGGIPSAVHGMSREVVERLHRVRPPLSAGGDRSNTHWGFGGTLAGNHLAIAGMKATLAHVLTEEKFAHMFAMGERIERSIRATIEKSGLPWHVVRMGTRIEMKFMPTVPRNGSEARRNRHRFLDQFIQLFLLNRGVLISPFRNVILAGPDLVEEDVEAHNRSFEDCVAALA
jgi:glutamate-1-semialdehyde 2,1-aminomutase